MFSSFKMQIFKGLCSETKCLLESGLFKNRPLFLEKISSRPCHSATPVFSSEEQEAFPFAASYSATPVLSSEEQDVFPLAARVVKSLDGQVISKMSFRNAVKVHGFPYSIDTFRVFVHVFASVGMEREVYSLLFNVVSYYQAFDLDMFELFPFLLGGKPPHPEISIAVFDVLMKVFAANSLFESGLHVFYQTKKLGLTPSIRSCNFLLKCLIGKSKADSARMLFEDLKTHGPSPNVYTYSIMMNLYCRGQNVDISQATDILEDMKKSGESPSVTTYSTYINGLCRGGFLDIALGIVREMECRKHPLNSYCYNPVISAFCQQGRLCEALEVFEGMENNGISPDHHSFGILLDGFCKQGDVENSFHLVRKMLVSGVKLNIVNYSSLLTGLCKAGLHDFSLKLFRGLSASGYKHDMISYNTLVNEFCMIGDMDSASKLLEEMIHYGYVPDSFTFGSVIRGCCEVGLLGKAKELFNVMKTVGLLPGVFVWNVIVDRICKEGDLEQALKLIYEMQDQGILPNSRTYHAIIKRLCDEKMSEKALALISFMVKFGSLHINCFNTMINGLVKQSLPREAWKACKGMLGLGISLDIVTYTVLIKLFCRTNEMEKAWFLFAGMKKRGLMPDVVTYTTMMAGYRKMGDMVRCNALADEMRRRILGLVSCPPYLYTLSSFVDLIHTMAGQSADSQQQEDTNLEQEDQNEVDEDEEDLKWSSSSSSPILILTTPLTPSMITLPKPNNRNNKKLTRFSPISGRAGRRGSGILFGQMRRTGRWSMRRFAKAGTLPLRHSIYPTGSLILSYLTTITIYLIPKHSLKSWIGLRSFSNGSATFFQMEARTCPFLVIDIQIGY
ncbi:pentatricopeptide repeat-containing protein At1g62670, mitochondrial-like [Tripterygium wilfordii]|uniref:pentatricopeptide repeat-containing protein At1g62670, mitochondrial-like n=1 Tax=Tripterygium wilfordii TaxID=458696 RepID=UPI0018F82FA3|nr:pentatricopeptide repeat-containing protein At1g62670, mitochondrial-like [Tripterygium wilfordii]XP_038693112.1 pentatricopeptide repeat-containing protein At1g62670, mitochondrial-like [Tripterygium wilfordii]XP_038693122.1 pentatricopeptide repeat-containing protein At1g62670, mitochondrial-like [Tripterygium wilfordii]